MRVDEGQRQGNDDNFVAYLLGKYFGDIIDGIMRRIGIGC
jgi:hypothetical protein